MLFRGEMEPGLNAGVLAAGKLVLLMLGGRRWYRLSASSDTVCLLFILDAERPGFLLCDYFSCGGRQVIEVMRGR